MSSDAATTWSDSRRRAPGALATSGSCRDLRLASASATSCAPDRLPLLRDLRLCLLLRDLRLCLRTSGSLRDLRRPPAASATSGSTSASATSGSDLRLPPRPPALPPRPPAASARDAASGSARPRPAAAASPLEGPARSSSEIVRPSRTQFDQSRQVRRPLAGAAGPSLVSTGRSASGSTTGSARSVVGCVAPSPTVRGRTSVRSKFMARPVVRRTSSCASEIRRPRSSHSQPSLAVRARLSERDVVSAPSRGRTVAYFVLVWAQIDHVRRVGLSRLGPSFCLDLPISPRLFLPHQRPPASATSYANCSHDRAYSGQESTALHSFGQISRAVAKRSLRVGVAMRRRTATQCPTAAMSETQRQRVASISATRNDSSSDCWWLSLGSQAVSYRIGRVSSSMPPAPPRHSVTSSPVSSM